MNETYKYKGAPEARALGPLPEGDYSFVVAQADRPYWKNDKWILAVKLIVEPSGLWVFANPWTGTDKNGEDRDGIADFLLAVNRVPALNSEPDWKAIIGARGKCRLKIEIAQAGALEGKEVNKVAFFHRPKEIKASNVSPEEYKRLHEEQRQRAAALDRSALTPDPDDIPF